MRTVSRILASAGCALAAAVAMAQETPLWREDTTHLRDDVQVLERCLAQPAPEPERPRACLDVFPGLCAEGVSDEEASTTLFQGRCAWRAIAAWEEVLARATKALEAMLRPEERKAFAAAAKAWAAFVDANVASRSAEFAGGSLAGVTASEVRARMTAERALELRQWQRDRAEQ